MKAVEFVDVIIIIVVVVVVVVIIIIIIIIITTTTITLIPETAVYNVAIVMSTLQQLIGLSRRSEDDTSKVSESISLIHASLLRCGCCCRSPV